MKYALTTLAFALVIPTVILIGTATFVIYLHGNEMLDG
jgi:hypothetical protein